MATFVQFHKSTKPNIGFNIDQVEKYKPGPFGPDFYNLEIHTQSTVEILQFKSLEDLKEAVQTLHKSSDLDWYKTNDLCKALING